MRAGNNTFGSFVEDSNSSRVLTDLTPPNSGPISSADQNVDQDATWIVQSSSKPRRLVPQFSLTRQDLGTDKSLKQPAENIKKKVVIRFTKEEILNKRKYGRMLNSLNTFKDIISSSRQDPVSYTKLDPEDVLRLWNNHNKELIAARARGRGKQQGRGEESGTDSVWAKPSESYSASDRQSDPWASDVSGGAGDLSDLAAVALSFRSQITGLANNETGELTSRVVEEDTMLQLLKEQTVPEEVKEEGMESLPAWASDELTEKPMESLQTNFDTNTLRILRGVNTEGLNGTTLAAPYFAGNSIFSPSAPLFSSLLPSNKTLESSTSLSSIHESQSLSFGFGSASSPNLVAANTQISILSPPLAPEWFYLDPQNKVQGPFSQENMRAWHEGNYFPPDLPIKLKGWQSFQPFHDVFPELHSAFLSLPIESTPSFSLMMNSDASVSSVLVMPVVFTADSSHMTNADSSSTQPRLAANEIAKGTSFVTSIPNEIPSYSSSQHSSVAVVSSNFHTVQLNSMSTHKTDIAKQLLGIASTKPLPPNVDSTHGNDNSAKVVKSSESSQNISTTSSHQSVADSVQSPSNFTTKNEKLSVPAGVQDKKTIPVAYKSASSLPSSQSQAIGRNSEIKTSNGPVSALRMEKNPENSKEQQENSKAKKGWNIASSVPAQPTSLSVIQREEEKTKTTSEEVPVVSAPGANISNKLKNLLGVKSPADQSGQIIGSRTWSAVPVTGISGLSLRDIMQEEIKQQQQQEADYPHSISASSWAAKARTVSSSNNQQVIASLPSQGQPISIMQRSRISSQPLPGVKDELSSQMSQHASNTTKSLAEKNEFGGAQMPVEMAEWCSQQLRRISKGSDDLTLLHFCMTLRSAAEIRETLSSYLGSSPQVTNFATEFIRYKEEGKKPWTINPGGSSTDVDLNRKLHNTSQGFVSASKKKKSTPTLK